MVNLSGTGFGTKHETRAHSHTKSNTACSARLDLTKTRSPDLTEERTCRLASASAQNRGASNVFNALFAPRLPLDSDLLRPGFNAKLFVPYGFAARQDDLGFYLRRT